MKKQILALVCVLSLTLAFGLTASDAQAGTKKHTLKIAHTTLPAPSASRAAIEEFAERVNKETDVRIPFKVYGF